MKVYRLVVKDNKVNKELFIGKYDKKAQADEALRRAKTIKILPEIEFYVITAEILEEKK